MLVFFSWIKFWYLSLSLLHYDILKSGFEYNHLHYILGSQLLPLSVVQRNKLLTDIKRSHLLLPIAQTTAYQRSGWQEESWRLTFMCSPFFSRFSYEPLTSGLAFFPLDQYTVMLNHLKSSRNIAVFWQN